MFKKGYKMSEEHKKKIGLSNSISRKGLKLSDETKRKLSLIHRGKKHRQMSEQGRRNISLAAKGRKWSRETIEKRRISVKNTYDIKGRKTPINIAIRKSLEYKLWRDSVYKRDNYTCIWCGQVGGNLNADHIKPFSLFPELRFAIDNGRTLCKICHMKTDTYGSKSRESFIKKILKESK